MIGGVTVQIVRDWVARLNAHGPAADPDRRTPPGIGHGDQGRADPCRPSRGALACVRPVPVVVGRLRGAGAGPAAAALRRNKKIALTIPRIGQARLRPHPA